MDEALVGIVALLSVFGFPTFAYYLRGRHKERMRALENQADAHRVAALEAARSDLESRVRTLESIVTAGDQDLEARLRQLQSGLAPPQQPARLTGRPG
jgi:hypothetical protein